MRVGLANGLHVARAGVDPPLLVRPGEFKHNAERNEVAVTLEQTQPADHTLFTVDIEVLVTYTLPGAPERHAVLLTVPLGTRGTARKETAVALLPTGAKPVMVQVDPENKVLFTLEFNPGTIVETF